MDNTTNKKSKKQKENVEERSYAIKPTTIKDKFLDSVSFDFKLIRKFIRF